MPDTVTYYGLNVARNNVLDTRYRLRQSVVALVDALPEKWFINEKGDQFSDASIQGVAREIARQLFFIYDANDRTQDYFKRTIAAIMENTPDFQVDPLWPVIQGVWQKLRAEDLFERLDAAATKALKEGERLDIPFAQQSNKKAAFKRIGNVYCNEHLNGSLSALVAARRERIILSREAELAKAQAKEGHQTGLNARYQAQEALKAKSAAEQQAQEALQKARDEKKSKLAAQKAQESAEATAAALEQEKKELEQSNRKAQEERKLLEREKEKERERVEAQKDELRRMKSALKAAQSQQNKPFEDQLALAVQINELKEALPSNQIEQAYQQSKQMLQLKCEELDYLNAKLTEESYRNENERYEALAVELSLLEDELAKKQARQAAIQSTMADMDEEDPDIELFKQRHDTIEREIQALENTRVEKQVEAEKLQNSLQALTIKHQLVSLEYDTLEKNHQEAREKREKSRQDAVLVAAKINRLLDQLRANVKKLGAYAPGIETLLNTPIPEYSIPKEREDDSVGIPSAQNAATQPKIDEGDTRSQADKARWKEIKEYIAGYPRSPIPYKKVKDNIDALENINAVDEEGRLLISYIMEKPTLKAMLNNFLQKMPELSVWRDTEGRNLLQSYLKTSPNLDILKILIDYVDLPVLNAQDNQGNTVLHTIVGCSLQEGPKRQAIKALIGRKMDSTLLNNAGKTARELAPVSLRTRIPMPAPVPPRPEELPLPILDEPAAPGPGPMPAAPVPASVPPRPEELPPAILDEPAAPVPASVPPRPEELPLPILDEPAAPAPGAIPAAPVPPASEEYPVSPDAPKAIGGFLPYIAAAKQGLKTPQQAQEIKSEKESQTGGLRFNEEVLKRRKAIGYSSDDESGKQDDDLWLDEEDRQLDKEWEVRRGVAQEKRAQPPATFAGQEAARRKLPPTPTTFAGRGGAQ